MRVLAEQARAKGRLFYVAVELPNRRIATHEELLHFSYALRRAARNKGVILFAADAPKYITLIERVRVAAFYEGAFKGRGLCHGL